MARIFSTCKVTKVCSIHTCELSTRSCRTANLFSKNRKVIDMRQLSTAVGVLKLSPKLKATNLRPLLLNAVPNTVVIDAHFLKKLGHELHYTTPQILIIIP